MAASTFSVSAFGAHISPSQLTVDASHGSDEDLLGCTIYIKAVLPEVNVQEMMQLLQTQSPLQVYTVSLGSVGAEACYDILSASKPLAGVPGVVTPLVSAVQAKGQTGTLYLFGVDRPGQLARITEALGRFGVTILHLRVQCGGADADEVDFVPSAGGPLAENRMQLTFGDAMQEEGSEDLLRREIQRVGEKVGYAVTCLMTDCNDFRTVMPSYLLRRKAFAMTYLDVVSMQTRGRPRRPQSTAPSRARFKCLPGVGGRSRGGCWLAWRRRVAAA